MSYSSVAGGGGGFFMDSEAVTGIGKFDPALGTLTEINLFAEFEAEFSIDVFGVDVIDDAEPHSVDFDADFIQFFIGYKPAGSSSTFVLPELALPAFASCFGAPFEGECMDSFCDGATVVDGTDVMGVSGLVLADFVGAGDVDTLSAFIAIPVPGGGQFILDNVFEGEADLFAAMYNVDLTVEYVCTPIPEPATFSLLALGGLAFLRRRGWEESPHYQTKARPRGGPS